MSNDKEVHGLSKIPLELLFKQRGVKIGKLQSHIQELEDYIRKSEDIKTLKKLKKENANLKRRIKKLTNDKRRNETNG